EGGRYGGLSPSSSAPAAASHHRSCLRAPMSRTAPSNSSALDWPSPNSAQVGGNASNAAIASGNDRQPSGSQRASSSIASMSRQRVTICQTWKASSRDKNVSGTQGRASASGASKGGRGSRAPRGGG